MPYQAEQDTTIPKVIGTRKGPLGKTLVLKESINYATGAIVLEKDIDPDVLSRLEAGDDHLSTLLRYVDPAEARAIMAEQQAEFASQFTGEEEVLHLEERLAGDGPTADPTVEVEDGPGYEPPVETEGSGAENSTHVETGDQTIGQGTSEVEETAEQPAEADEQENETEVEAETVEEAAEGASESEGDADTEVADESDTSTEDQSDEQGSDTEAQETEAEGDTEASDTDADETEGDKFDAMDLVELRAAAKAADIKGRTKMKETELREALRA